MDRSDKRHMEEKLNLRSFYLRLLGKIWIIPLSAIVGALIAVGIYTLATVTFGPAKTYRGEARLYISFAYDENKGTQVDYYNGYTWNNMIVPTDDIMNPIISELAAHQIYVKDNEGNVSGTGGLTITKDELISSISADIPSDVRIMLLSAENKDKELADEILMASIKTFEEYGNTNSAFDSIKRLSVEKARLVTYSDRSVAAIIFGGIIGAVVSVLWLLLLNALDDAIYVPEDIEKRYAITSLGVLFDGKESAISKASDEIYRNELTASLRNVLSGKSEVVVISTDSINDDVRSSADCSVLLECAGIKGKSDKDTSKESDYVDSIDISREWPKVSPMSVPGKVLDNYRKIGTCDGVILCVPYGRKNGAMAEHVIAQLCKHECPVLGIVMVRADRKFIDRYYGYGK